MDNQHSNSSLFELTLNENLKNSLRGAATWAGIVGILTLVSSILGFVQYFMLKNKAPQFQRLEGFDGGTYETAGGASIASPLISLVISLIIFVFLNRFSTNTKNGINGNSPDRVSTGLQGLSSYFILWGVFVIIMLIFVVVVVIGAAAGGSR